MAVAIEMYGVKSSFVESTSGRCEQRCNAQGRSPRPHFRGENPRTVRRPRRADQSRLWSNTLQCVANESDVCAPTWENLSAVLSTAFLKKIMFQKNTYVSMSKCKRNFTLLPVNTFIYICTRNECGKTGAKPKITVHREGDTC